MGSPRVTILSASSVRTMVHCVVKYSRPPDLKSSSNVSLPFAWITGPATDPSFMWCVRHYFVTTVVQAFDFWLTRKTPVWAKSLKSEQLKLHKCVNNKKSACFIIQKLSRNFKCPKMAHRQAKISNSKYSYWIREGFSILKNWKSQKIQKFGNPEYLNPRSFSNSESRKS